MVQLRAVGGAVNDVDPAATAYAHRTQNFSLAGRPPAAAGARRSTRGGSASHRTCDGVYLSFETNQSPARVAEAFPPDDARPDRRGSRPPTTRTTCSTATSESRRRRRARATMTT